MSRYETSLEAKKRRDIQRAHNRKKKRRGLSKSVNPFNVKLKK